MDNKKELSIMIGGAVRRSKKKKSPQSKKKYELFLNGDVQKKGRKQSPKRSDIRVIKVNKSKEGSNKEGPKDVKKEGPKDVKKEGPKDVKKEGPKDVKKEGPKDVKKSKHPSPIKHRKSRKSNKHNRSRKKNLKRSSKRVSSKTGLHRKYVNNRKVSLKCVPHNKKKDIDKILNSIHTMSTKDIKEKLSKKGITIKSNKQQLLKDMYIFSELGGIKIHKE
jgi:hypothetical protein